MGADDDRARGKDGHNVRYPSRVDDTVDMDDCWDHV